MKLGHVSTLRDGGLDLRNTNTGIVVWATKSFGTVFRIDNVRFTGYDENADAVDQIVTVPFNLTQLGKGSYSDTINPASYRCVYDYGDWIYNAGVVEPAISLCNTVTGTPQGDPCPIKPQLAGAAAEEPTMTHRWWGSIPFIGEMRIGDPAGAGYITPELWRGLRSSACHRNSPGFKSKFWRIWLRVPDPFAEVFDGAAIAKARTPIWM